MLGLDHETGLDQGRKLVRYYIAQKFFGNIPGKSVGITVKKSVGNVVGTWLGKKCSPKWLGTRSDIYASWIRKTMVGKGKMMPSGIYQFNCSYELPPPPFC